MSRNYSNFAKTASLAAPVAAGDASIPVDTQTDYPAPSYVIVVYEGAGTPQAAPKKETMLVTGVTDNGDGTFTLTVNRDIDGYNGGGISFSDAATVEHTVVADEVGPPRSEILSQGVRSFSGTRTHHNWLEWADFSGSAADANGYEIASGKTLTVHQGTASVEDGRLKLSDPGTIVTFPFSTTTGWTARADMAIQNQADGGVVMNRLSGGDHVDLIWGGNASYLIMQEELGGTYTQIFSTSGGPETARGSVLPTMWAIRDPKFSSRFAGTVEAFQPQSAALKQGVPDSSLQTQNEFGFIHSGTQGALYVDSFVIFDSNA